MGRSSSGRGPGRVAQPGTLASLHHWRHCYVMRPPRRSTLYRPPWLLVGGATLPLALAELGLIDEYEFVVHPGSWATGPTLFAGA